MSWSLEFFGTRGSIPTPGADTVRYGGNTPCLLVRSTTGHRLILDAGTGIRPLGRRLVDAGDRLDLTILLSHTHWDHIQGLPFFGPLYLPGSTVTIRGPKPVGHSLEEILRQQMLPPVFPVPVEALAARFEAIELAAGHHDLAGFSVRAISLCHPSPTLGFAIGDTTGGPAVAYLTDNELGLAESRRDRPTLVRFLQKVDTLVHDAMYFDSERSTRRGWGHSTAAEAVELALESGVRRLALFHHDPAHDDTALDRLRLEAEQARVAHGGSLDIIIAAEGLVLGPVGA
ncbi:MAG: MBL fold metallo-hydrolase [Gemmatimonadales bacterium]